LSLGGREDGTISIVPGIAPIRPKHKHRRKVMIKSVVFVCVIWLIALSASGQSLNTQLFNAAKAGNVEQITDLLKKGSDVNCQDKMGRTPLMWAVNNEHPEVVRKLLKAGADINQTDKMGGTAIHYSWGNDIVMGILLKYGADINCRDSYGFTALIMACRFGTLKMVEFMLQNGADVNIYGSNGETPLMSTEARGKIEIARLLLEHGADIDAASKDGVSPLLMAIMDGRMSFVKFLLDNGANANRTVKLDDGKVLTYVKYAEELGEKEIAELLRKYVKDNSPDTHPKTR